MLISSLTGFDSDMLRRSGTYDSVPSLRTKQESSVSDMSKKVYEGSWIIIVADSVPI